MSLPSNNTPDDNQDSVLLEHFNFLKKTGILDHINALKSESQYQRQLIDEALEVINRTTVHDLIEYIISRFLDRFIPAHLLFVLKSEYDTGDLDIIAYEKMNRVPAPIVLESLNIYADFFSNHQGPAAYTLLERSVGNSEDLAILEPVSPEILAPVMGQGGLLGLIIIGRKVLGEEYSDQEIAYISRMMQFISASLQNIIHYASATTDAKTKLYNHSFFMIHLNRELARSRRYGREFALLLCDLDFFKKVNDTHGHLAGDKVLYQLSRVLEDAVRKSDVVARYGGEEFVLILPETNRKSAWVVAERIRRSVSDTTISHNGISLRVTISVGGYHVAGDEDQAADEVMERADQALYWAKDHGRNRSAFYRPGLYFMGTFYYEGNSVGEMEGA